jgi:hypothetical protein
MLQGKIINLNLKEKSKALIHQDKSAKLETPKLVSEHANRENTRHTFSRGIR